jgi:hypothetical protein
MTNVLIPFECPICGSDGFTQVEVKGRDGSSRLTQAYEAAAAARCSASASQNIAGF